MDMKPDCGRCRHFIGEPADLERSIPGLRILSSAYGSVRADTGLCNLRDQMVVIRSTCARFSASEARGGHGD